MKPMKGPAMSFSMYDVTIPVLIRGLSVLSGYLDKAAAYAADNKFAPSVLVNARLAPDMSSLAGQVQRASDTSKGAVARLTGATMPSFPDTETTLDELKQRIEKTIDLLKAVKPQDLEGSDSKPIELKFGKLSKTFRGDAYVTTFLLPNFFFHITTAHDILRHNGLKIGKLDYLGSFE
jgi:hypothetical protein